MTRRRRPACLRTSLLALALVATGAAVPASAEERGALTARGTLQVVVIDGADEHGVDEHGAEDAALVTDARAVVDGLVVDVPDAAVAGLAPGAAVDVALDAPAGLSVAAAVRALALGGDDAVAVTGVRSAAGRTLTGPAAPQAAGEPAASPPRAAVDPTGDRTLLVLPVHWGAPDAATAASLRTVADETAAFWTEQSGGRVRTAVTVRDWVRVTAPTSAAGACDIDVLFNRALAAHGVTTTPGPRQHVLVYFPNDTACGRWAGQAEVGGGRIWVNGYPRTDVVAHELGHNLGLGHANQLLCTDGGTAVPLSGACTEREYEDRPDVMSFSNGTAPGGLNTALADALGLLQSVPVPADPTTTQTVRLAPLGQVGAVRALEITTPTGKVYVDYRPATGRDVRYAPWAGVQVHRVVQKVAPTSQLLNLQPGSDRQSMPVGSTWDVPGTTVRLTVVAVDAAGAQVEVAPRPRDPLAPFTDVRSGHPFLTEISWFAEQGITTGYADGSYGGGQPVARQAMAAFLYRFTGQQAAALPAEPQFWDVPASHVFFREISWLGASGITTGYPDGSFGHTQPVARDAMAAFLFRLHADDAYEAPAAPLFPDVGLDHPFYREISWLAESGITRGLADGSFGSGQTVSREAMAAFLFRYDTRFGPA